jgi:nicotinamidase-related amidase
METEKAALLVMDVQPGIADRLENKEEFITHLKGTVDEAHRKQILVIYVVVGFRTGFPEVSTRNKLFNAIRTSPTYSALVNPSPSIEPTQGDIVVLKRRVSAFSGSDLEVILRALDVNHLILTGIATSGVVLSTTREAADKDYKLTILSDLCADSDPEVHALLLEKILPRQATVMTSKEWYLGRNEERMP